MGSTKCVKTQVGKIVTRGDMKINSTFLRALFSQSHFSFDKKRRVEEKQIRREMEAEWDEKRREQKKLLKHHLHSLKMKQIKT